MDLVLTAVRLCSAQLAVSSAAAQAYLPENGDTPELHLEAFALGSAFSEVELFVYLNAEELQGCSWQVCALLHFLKGGQGCVEILKQLLLWSSPAGLVDAQPFSEAAPCACPIRAPSFAYQAVYLKAQYGLSEACQDPRLLKSAFWVLALCFCYPNLKECRILVG